MHLLPTATGTLDEEARAVDLDHAPAELVILSFSDSDLGVAAAAHAAGGADLPTLRLVRLAALTHPLSVDLYIERVIRHARVVLVRLLGGLEYWRYGVEEVAAAARRHGVHLAVVPGDGRADARSAAASTMPPEALGLLWRCFQDGGADNVGQALRFMAAQAGHALEWREPVPLPSCGLFAAGCRPAPAGAPHALILFYRSVLTAADTAPITALAQALGERGARVTSLYVTSLKDPAAAAALAERLDPLAPDVILNTTAFSARSGRSGAVTDRSRAPVLQVMLSTATREAWGGSGRGLGAADLAMNVVLPEIDGRIIAGALSFKAAPEGSPEGAARVHRPEPSRVAHAADLALAWARLRHTPRGERQLACVLSDYPGRDGRTGYAVGLDTPASVIAIADHLRREGFSISPLPPSGALMAALTQGERAATLAVADYERRLVGLPSGFVASLRDAWGSPAADPAVQGGAFAFRTLRAGHLVIGVQPDRGAAAERRADYHDTARPPRHAYVAFYMWLREVERIDALIHLGTHGTLEWLPGKAVALGPDCAPEAVLGPVPVIYPFIVNNPGEAAQAKRRIGAVTISHLTPPLVEAGPHGAAVTLEALFDEYAQAMALDPRRARLLAGTILEQARDSGLLADANVPAEGEPETLLARLDAWLCDLKELRIGDGLHVFGHSPSAGDASLVPAQAEKAADLAGKLARCGPAELRRLVIALDGGFVQPGPAGAPARGRLDVLPTGRNLFTVDPRAVPTPTACTIGARMAAEVMTRHAQDHGEYPRAIVLDLWGSATMRTGGDDLGQAFALIGAGPTWDPGSGRVTGYAILPQARLDWPRVDVTLRISGLFRDTFPEQIALFDAACRAIAALDEPDAENALAASRRQSPEGALGPRVFGAQSGHYGVGLARTIADGRWRDRAELGEAYLAATTHAFGTAGEDAAPAAFRARVAAAEAFVHTNDLPGTDILDAAPSADHQGGFAAAADLLGAKPALYALDTTRPDHAAVRTLAEDIARAVRGRATHPRWIAGQMRHGHRGAAEIAETVDNLFALAALTDAVPSRHFDGLFDATCGDAEVRAFLLDANPPAARSIAARFGEAIERRFWTSRRNSVAAILADMGRGGVMTVVVSPPMPPPAPLRVGWCPGALRPMRAGDGLLVRLKPRRHRLTLPQAMAVAALARHYGNGALTLTARGNLQLRGVDDAGLPALTAALDELGLLDRSPEGEAVRNVVSNPLAGLDPAALCDLGSIVRALEERLATEAGLWRLPAKFSWCLDEQGRFGLAGVTADIRFEALRRNGAVMLAVTLDGGDACAHCRPDEVVAVAGRLAEAYLALCDEAGVAPHRMRDLTSAVGDAPVLRRAGLAPEARDSPAGVARESAPAPIGPHLSGAWSVVGAAPAFGLLDATTLHDLARRAEAAGAHDLRLTPWRSLLVGGLAEAEAAALATDLAHTALILDAADPRLAVAACVGAPACARATTPVPADAARIAARLSGRTRGGPRLHLSGCPKGCAHGGDAPVTLVGRAGRYDLVRGGRADGAPSAFGLSLDAALAVVAEAAL